MASHPEVMLGIQYSVPKLIERQCPFKLQRRIQTLPSDHSQC